MCGITGIIRFNEPASKNEIEGMTSSLSHRGPDGVGLWLNTNVAIGHRRLSIIDIENGRQPMCNEDGTIWITYNGEIYNFLYLREQLIDKGHQFRSHSDTEVIIHAYEEWEDDCVNHFRGMFAFGIVDQRRKRVFLARDHLGIKPLVYYSDKHCFAFASELQALRHIDGAQFDIDVQSLDQYLLLQYIPASRSIFKQTHKLLPAHCMSVTFDGKITEPIEYWRVEFKPDYRRTENEWIEELDAVLRDSVKAHLVSDVPFGAFLSGGVDSSAIVAYMAQILDRPVQTFSIGFEEDEFNELKYADFAAKRWDTEHHVEIVKPDALSILQLLVRNYGEPFGDSSAIPTYYVSKLSRKYVSMVLSGDGGDELFAGYHSYLRWMKFIDEKQVDNSNVCKKMLYPLAQRMFPLRYPPKLKYGESLENWLTFINYIPIHWRQRLWRKDYKEITHRPLDIFEKEYARTKEYKSNANKVQYMDLKTYLPFDILTKVDIASMLNGLEVRTPMVDKEVVSFAATIPESFNIRKSPNGEWQGKMLLKGLMEKYYPADFLKRAKMGFSIPIEKWFAVDGILHNTLIERLTGKESKILDFFDPEIVRKLIFQNSAGPLWLLLFLEEWLKQNTTNE